MDSAELTEWHAFSNIEPLLGRRMDLNTAMLVCAALNPWMKDKSLEVSDVIPEWEKLLPGEEGRQAAVAQDMIRFGMALQLLNGPAAPASPSKQVNRPPRIKPVRKPPPHLRGPREEG